MKQAIIYVITTLELGGAQKVCLELFNKCHNQSRTTFLITGGTGPLAQLVTANDRVIILPALVRKASISNIFKEVHAFFKIYQLIKKIKKEFDSVIVHTHSSKAGIIGRWAAWFAGIENTVHTIHGFAFHEHQPKHVSALYKLIEKITARITSSFVCVSEHDIHIGQKLIHKFKDRTYKIRAAIADPEITIKQKTFKDNTFFIIGTISCFKPQKNILDLLQAFVHAYQYNHRLRLEIIGDGIERPLIESFIQAHNLEHAVTLHGWKFSVYQHLIQWDLFALSSLWEGLPCSVIEARTAKLPVVAYKTGGIPEVIMHNQNGLLCEQKAWRQMAEAFIACASNKFLYERLANASDSYLAEFSIQTMVEQHHRLYNEKTAVIKRNSTL